MISKTFSALFLSLSLTLCAYSAFCDTDQSRRWNKKYDFIYDIPPLSFYYDHGVMAGSYESGHDKIGISFEDVSVFLGHVCLCGAGGYKISQLAVNALKKNLKPLHRGDFMIISSKDHTISDVIAFTLGSVRRNDTQKNSYFIDTSIEAPRREYHYYIGYTPGQKAVHIIYKKHLLIGNDFMDRLWTVELDYEKDPSSVSTSDIKLYQDTMEKMVKDVLLDRREGLFEIEPIDYSDFLIMINELKGHINE